MRLAILDDIAAGEQTVGKIVRTTQIPQAVTSQQLKVLVDFGLVTRRRDGNHVYCRIAKPEVVKVLMCVRQGLSGK